jgi:hypothetical protein
MPLLYQKNTAQERRGSQMSTETEKPLERIGVVCHLDSNIARIVDVQQAAEWAASD